MFLQHKYFLFEALKAATTFQGQCSPNPAVGAVLVRDNHIVRQGAHQGPGHAHAEVVALEQIENAEGATLYVTLEPCCHYGRTPPCTERIIKAKLKAVYYAYADPNPLVAGKGAEQLRQSGIVCEQIELAEINVFYRAYEHWWKTKKPWVQAKLAISANGKVASLHKRPFAITGEEAQLFTHFMRAQADAILTTVETVLHDDPALNVRSAHGPLTSGLYPEAEFSGLVGAAMRSMPARGPLTSSPYPEAEFSGLVGAAMRSMPARGPLTSGPYTGAELAKPVYVLDSKLRSPQTARLHQTAQKLTLFYSQEAPIERLAELQEKPYELIQVKNNEKGLCLDEILTKIGEDGIQTLWVEAGPRLWTNLHVENQVHQTYLYCSHKNLPTEAYGLDLSMLESLLSKDELRYYSLGEDTLITIDR